jgi:hypothetical protein
VGAFVLVAVCVVVLATPAGARRHQPQSSLTIRVFWSVIAERVARDMPPKNRASVSDVYWYSASLTNREPQFGQRSGAIVGVAYDTVTILPAHAVLVRERSVLPGGKIYSRARVSRALGAARPLDVVGGTGRYTGARGSVSQQVIGRLAVNETYRLRLP